MSEKVLSVYLQQVDKYHMECDPADFASKTLSLVNSAFMDVQLTPSEYMKLCYRRAQLLLDYGITDHG